MESSSRGVEKRDPSINQIKKVKSVAFPPQSGSPKILVVDDDNRISELITSILKMRGFDSELASSVKGAMSLLSRQTYDIIFLDLGLPDGSGFSILESILRDSPESIVIVITGMHDINTAIKSIRKGAHDFITKPFEVKLFKERLDRVTEEWKSRRLHYHYQQNLENLVKVKTDELLKTTKQIEHTYDMTVSALGAALDLRDPETADHCRRVSENSVRLGQKLGFSNTNLRNLKWGAYLHDIGKIAVPDQVLLKKSSLTKKEMELVKKHPIVGSNMIKNVDFLSGATDIILHHHEKYDGSGYPFGLKKKEIPLSARIFAIMDTLDSMTSDRPYRRALPFSVFIKELGDLLGKHFDPEIVREFLEFPNSTWSVVHNF